MRLFVMYKVFLEMAWNTREPGFSDFGSGFKFFGRGRTGKSPKKQTAGTRLWFGKACIPRISENKKPWRKPLKKIDEMV